MLPFFFPLRIASLRRDAKLILPLVQRSVECHPLVCTVLVFFLSKLSLYEHRHPHHHRYQPPLLHSRLHFSAVLRGSALLLLRLGQAAGTRLHCNSDAHPASPGGHVGDTRPLVSFRAITLDAGQEALLVKTTCPQTKKQRYEIILFLHD